MGRVAGLTSADVRDRLLAAAVEVIFEQGYENARINEIARRAGLSVGAIYSNFGTKAELLAQAVAMRIPAQLAELFAAGSSEAALALVRELAHALPARSTEQGAMIIESFAAARRDPEVEALVRKTIRRHRTGLRHAVDQAQRDGLTRPDLDAEAIAHLCMAVVLGCHMMHGLEIPRPDARAWSALTDRLIGSVLTGPLPAET